MATIYQQVEKLKERLKAKEATIEEMEARKRHKARQKERKDDTRRKILIGAAVQARVDNKETSQEELTSLLDKYLTKPHDRALFEYLPPRPATPKNKSDPGADSETAVSPPGPDQAELKPD